MKRPESPFSNAVLYSASTIGKFASFDRAFAWQILRLIRIAASVKMLPNETNSVHTPCEAQNALAQDF